MKLVAYDKARMPSHSYRDTFPFVCTRATFYAMLDDPEVARQIERVRAAKSDSERQALKKFLPGFCFHAWFDGDKPRKAENAHLSGLTMVDIDHVDPMPLWEKLKPRVDELQVALVHVTPSDEGLRVVFVTPQGMTIPEAQRWFGEVMEVEIDAVTKDSCRASFGVTRKDVLYMDEKRLFETESIKETLTKTITKTKKESDENRDNSKQRLVPVSHNKDLRIEGVRVTDIVNAYWGELQMNGTIKGSVPVEGERHMALMHLARDIAPYLGMDEQLVMSALPRLKDDEKELADIARDSVEFLKSKDATKKGRVIGRLIKEIQAMDAQQCAYLSVEECAEFEAMLPALPKCLQMALRVLAPGLRFPAMMVLLALAMCLADRVKVKMGNFPADRMRALLHLDGASGSGKGVSYLPAKAVMATFKDRHKRAMDERSNWKAEAANGNGEKGKKKEKRDVNKVFPDVRIMPTATTANGQLEVAQSGRTLLTLETELAGMVRQFKKASYDRAPMLIPAFEGDDDGNLTQVGASVNKSSETNWVVITSGTRSALNMLIKHHGDVCDGLANRLAIVLLPKTHSADKLIAEHTAKEEAQLREVGEMLMQMEGLLCTPKLDKRMNEWKMQFEGESHNIHDSVKNSLSGRVARIAFRFACAMQLYYEVDKLMKLSPEERTFDLSAAKPHKSLPEWGTIFADYFLDKQFTIFGNAMIRQSRDSFTDLIASDLAPAWLNRLPSTFTYADMHKMLNGSDNSFRQKVKRAKQKGLIKAIGEDGAEAKFVKV